MKYKRLNQEHGCRIWALHSMGISLQKEIACLLGTRPITISRECRRNRGYRHGQAHAKAMERSKKACLRPKRMNPGVISLVERYLHECWKIAGVLRKNRSPMGYESIYRYIWWGSFLPAPK